MKPKKESKELVVMVRRDDGSGKPRQPLRRTLEQAEKKFFSNHAMRTGCFIKVEGYEAVDGKLVKKSGSKEEK